ncbi:glycosyltransferase [Adhaeribacter aquaticus]|uniref:glycosyltransferase n=1 Tax=Adhaeribacter aquaticus TaxID=299567 RepID=UPI0004046EDA|nr:glycosyltransferase [Adhaeribacter aquaticus]
MILSFLYYLLGVCVFTQIGYCCYYFIPFIFYKPKVLTNSAFPVSVIISAHNEAQNLTELLPLLLAQQYPRFEVVVVDDRSTDDTKKYLDNLSLNFPGLRIIAIDQTPPGINPKKYALTQGIKLARYEHLLFTDADCRPKSNFWIREIAKGFCADVGIILGYSPYIVKYRFLNKLIRYETLVTAIQYLSFAIKGDSYMGVGRNLAYTKSCFNRINGFSSHINTLGGDDDLLIRDAAKETKVNIVLSKESQTESIPKESYQEWIIQKRRHMAVGREYNKPDKLRIGIYMLSNIFFYLTLIMFLFVPTNNLMPLGILVGLRCVVLYLVYLLIAQKLKENLSVTMLPILDLVYILNYLVLGLSVLMYKKVRWK